jgi:hypothetical protein
MYGLSSVQTWTVLIEKLNPIWIFPSRTTESTLAREWQALVPGSLGRSFVSTSVQMKTVLQQSAMHIGLPFNTVWSICTFGRTWFWKRYPSSSLPVINIFWNVPFTVRFYSEWFILLPSFFSKKCLGSRSKRSNWHLKKERKCYNKCLEKMHSIVNKKSSNFKCKYVIYLIKKL